MRTEEKRFLFFRRFRTGTKGAFGDCACGATNYDIANKWDDDHQDHLETLVESEKVQFQTNSIEFIDIDGHLFVVGCKCKTDETLFSLLNEHRDDVIRYLKDTEDLSARIL